MDERKIEPAHSRLYKIGKDKLRSKVSKSHTKSMKNLVSVKLEDEDRLYREALEQQERMKQKRQ